MSSAPDEKKSKAQTFFQYGNDAAMKNNFDYAIDMYQRACKIDIENLLYRQALRGIERRKFGGDPKKVGRLVGTKNQPIRLRAKAHKAKKDWAGAIAVCEEAFVNNPWDVSAAWEAAEAAEQLGHVQLAQWLLESVYQQAQEAKEAEFFRYTAHVHELNESWQKAIGAWEQVKKMLPNDENANRQINSLSAKATIKRSGLGEKIDKHDEAVEQVPTAEEIRAEKMTPEERWLKEIEEEPTRISAYLNLADYYKMRGQLDEAEKLLVRGIKANPQDTNLRTEHAEVQMARINRFIEVQAKRLKEKPDDDEAKAKLAKATATLQEYEIKEYRRRIEVNPEDLGLHYNLGLAAGQGGQARRGDRLVPAGAQQPQPEGPGAAPDRPELRGQGGPEARRACLPGRAEVGRSRRHRHHQRAALPPGPRRRGAGQHRAGRGALQRGRRQRLLVPRRGAEAPEPRRRLIPAPRPWPPPTRCTTAWAASPRRRATPRWPRSTTTRSPPTTTRTSTWRRGSRTSAEVDPGAASVVCSSFRFAFDRIGTPAGGRDMPSPREPRPAMPNTPSAIKRLKQSTKRRMHNRITKKVIKTYTKRTLAAAAAKEFEKAEADFRTTIAKLAKAGARRVLHPNTAARRKSKLARDYREALAKARARADRPPARSPHEGARRCPRSTSRSPRSRPPSPSGTAAPAPIAEGRDPFEAIVAVVLDRAIEARKLAPALDALRDAGLLDPKAMAEADATELVASLRDAGVSAPARALGPC